MNEDGLWAQLEKGANKVTITDGDIRKAFEELYDWVPEKKERRMSVMTGSAGAKAINDAITQHADAEMHKIEVKRLIIELDQMLMAEKFDMKRYKTLTHLLMSDDRSNFEMAKKIMESYG